MAFGKVGVARCLAALALLFGLNGCAVYMAANQPDKKDLEVLKVGTPRSVVVAELGAPIQTMTRNGAKVELFSFVQGYSGIEKGGRAVFHGAADVFTLGLWEVVGTPIEGSLANGTKVAVEVTYDRDERVASITPIRGQEKIASPGLPADQ